MTDLLDGERYDSLPTGSELHGYRLEKVLGRGSFGITYMAVHCILNTSHVIKEFIPDCAVREGGSTVRPKSAGANALFEWGLNSFFEEACLLHRLSHPNIVKVTDVFKANGTAYFVMPYLQGQTLQEWAHQHPTPTRKELENIFIPLMEGLKYIHNVGLLHRDIKPENVYIQESGHPVLIDFGAARNVIGQDCQALTQILTAHYAPIEQYSSKGEFTAALDIYSLAATMYAVITGRVPDEAPQRLMDDQLPKLAADPKRVAAYGQNFLAAIDKAMSVKAKDRYQSAFDFQKALLEIGEGAPGQSARSSSEASPAAPAVPSSPTSPIAPDTSRASPPPAGVGERPEGKAFPAGRWKTAAAAVAGLLLNKCTRV